MTAAQALGGHSLFAKRSPRTQVFASLAPLDFHSFVQDEPHRDIALRANALVLAWDNVRGLHFVLAASRHRANALLSAHDAVLLAVRVGRWTVAASLGEEIGKVN